MDALALASQLGSARTMHVLGGAARALAASRMSGGCLRRVAAGIHLTKRPPAIGLAVTAAVRPQTGIGDADAQQHGDQHEANRSLRSRHHRIATRGKMNAIWIIVTVPAASQAEPARKSLYSPDAPFVLDAKSCRCEALPPGSTVSSHRRGQRAERATCRVTGGVMTVLPGRGLRLIVEVPVCR